jgi:glycerol-3-phosphate O-acyltransferase/dihydroxyacetone phosphate acyltransferase
MAIPLLWVSYAVVLYLYFQWELRTISLAFLCMPIASYIGVRSAEAGMVDLKDLRPAFLRLLPGYRTESQTLPARRMALAKEIRRIVKSYGPSLGALYYDRSDQWETEVRSLTRSSSEDLLTNFAASTSSSLEEDSLSAKDESREGERVPSGVSSRVKKE